MGFLSIDRWTGGNDTDIAGRTPDGGRNFEYTSGSWNEHNDYTAGQIDIVSGVARAVSNQDAAYVLTGVSTGGADYRVEGTFERLDLDTSAAVGVGLRANDAAPGSHYIFLYYMDSGGQAWIEIWWQVNYSTWGTLGGQNITMTDIGLPITIALEAQGTNLRAYVNGTKYIDVTDSNISAEGYPLLWINNGNSTVSWDCIEFNVQSLCAPITEVTWALVSEDAFTGGDDTDISGRTPDGDGVGTYAVGTWDENDNYTGGNIELVSGTIRGYSTQNNIYVIKDVSTGTNYRTEATFTRIDQVPTAFSAFVGVGLRVDEASPKSEIWLLYYQNSEIWTTGVYSAWVEIYWQTPSSYGWIGGARIPLVAPDTPVTLALEVYGSAVRAFVDANVVASGCSAIPTAAGYPAIWIRNRASALQPTWEGIGYRVLKEPAGAPPTGTRAFAAWI